MSLEYTSKLACNRFLKWPYSTKTCFYLSISDFCFELMLAVHCLQFWAAVGRIITCSCQSVILSLSHFAKITEYFFGEKQSIKLELLGRSPLR